MDTCRSYWSSPPGWPKPEFITAPIEVPWRVNVNNMTFSLRGWSCRIMQVIETVKARYFSVLAMPIWVTDGEFTISWIDEPVKTDMVTVVHAA